MFRNHRNAAGGGLSMALRGIKTYGDDHRVRRHNRVVENLKRELQTVMFRSVKDPRLGAFTITDLELSPDRRHAKVLVSKLLSSEEEISAEEKELLVEGLQSASHYIYEQLKKRMEMKVIPTLKFQYDDRFPILAKVWSLASFNHEEVGSSK